VEFTKKGIRKVIGAICKKGEKYAKEEIFSPKRVLTSSIRVLGGELPLVSVKTDRPIPREKIMDVMKVIYKAKRRAPVKAGSILIRNVAGIGVNIIATKEVHKFSQGSL
jgi:CxxC motif-containing protein